MRRRTQYDGVPTKTDYVHQRGDADGPTHEPFRRRSRADQRPKTGDHRGRARQPRSGRIGLRQLHTTSRMPAATTVEYTQQRGTLAHRRLRRTARTPPSLPTRTSP